MVAANEIGWGGYNGFSGPYYKGKSKYVLPANPSENHKILAVITATEGGAFDAYNGYDACISTSGLIQWCEAGMFGVSDMLGFAAQRDLELIRPVLDLAAKYGLEFKKNAKGRWRFFFHDERGEVDRRLEQQQMFLGKSDGKAWMEDWKPYAKEWAAAISTVWESQRAQLLQVDFTAGRMHGFCLDTANGLFKTLPPGPRSLAFRAAYLSFAANNPTWADRALKAALQDGVDPFSPNGLPKALSYLTFHPNVTIYPERYNKIRPALEKLYGVDLPDFAKELAHWEEREEMSMWSAKEVQAGLLTLGYDLGPSGVDGRWGDKSTKALLAFEKNYGVPEEYCDGKLDPVSTKKLQAVVASLKK